jgi:hypothetical protein
MSKSASVSSSRVEQAVLIVFADLTRFMVNSRSTPDATLAELFDGYYRHAEGLVSAAGVHVVKFMGDAFRPHGDRCPRRRSGARWTIRGPDRGMTSRQKIRTNTKGYRLHRRPSVSSAPDHSGTLVHYPGRSVPLYTAP